MGIWWWAGWSVSHSRAVERRALRACGKTHNGDAVIVDVSLLVELLLKLGVLAVGPGRVWC